MLTSEPRGREIDGLRGVAILSVVGFHLLAFPLSSLLSKIGMWGIASLLPYGVDLFFVISGYLIGTILLRIDGRSGISAFYIRRILRIWPLYYLLLFLVYSILPDKSMFSSVPRWTFFFFIPNLWEWHGVWAHQALAPLWSIAIEEQFYLFAPILFSILNKKQITILLVFYVVLSPILRWILLYNTEIDIRSFTPTSIDGICVGLLLAIFLSSPENLTYVTERINHLTRLAFFLLFMLIPSIMLLPDHLWISFGHSLVVLAFGSVLLSVQARRSLGWRTPFLNLPFLRYLGLRCYSIYLFHTFFVFIAIAFFDNFFAGLALELMLILLFAQFSWRYIEAPLMRLGHKFHYGNNSK